MTCTTLWALLGLMLAGCPSWFSATAEVTKPGKGVYLSGDVIIGESIFCTTLILYFLSEIEYMKILNYYLNQSIFLTFPACFEIPMNFSNFNSNCSDLLDLRNLQEQVKKAFCYQNLFWPFTVWINCSSDLKNFANSQPFSQSQE